nr:NADH dehydrogenase subunit 6 [Dynamostes audax]
MWLSIVLSTTFLFLNHPLSFGLIIICQTIMISIITGTLNFSFWFSYIIFLIMVGGMLILFMYMTSIASNEKFKLSYPLTLFVTSMILMGLILDTLIDKNLTKMMFKNEYLLNSTNTENLMMIKYFNFPNNLIYIMMIIYLLITLIMVVKITNIKYGPLRQKF